MKLNWNFQQGGVQTKKLSLGGVWLFSGTKQLIVRLHYFLIPTSIVQHLTVIIPHLHRRGKTGGFQISFFHCSRHVHDNKEMAHLKPQKLQENNTE